MKAVIQRVQSAQVAVGGKITGAIEQGILIYLGIAQGDTDDDSEYVIDKIMNVRIFSNEQGQLHNSLKQIDGDILIVSQFTLYGDCRKGRRPSFTQAMNPKDAKSIYEDFVQKVEYAFNVCGSGGKVATGEFAAHMMVSSVNDGPVTLILESKDKQ
jgi:D-tyrosyl-tRNA(Tyr) deacylase